MTGSAELRGALPSPREALAEAVRKANQGMNEGARVWTMLAAELRQGSPEPSGMTLHDVKGIVCAHGRVALQRRDRDDGWWLHADDRTSCDRPDEEDEAMRRRTTAAVNQADAKVSVPLPPRSARLTMAGYTQGQDAEPMHSSWLFASRVLMDASAGLGDAADVMWVSLAREIVERGDRLYRFGAVPQDDPEATATGLRLPTYLKATTAVETAVMHLPDDEQRS